MKVQRITGVNGVKENCVLITVNKGGTAEYFGPFFG